MLKFAFDRYFLVKLLRFSKINLNFAAERGAFEFDEDATSIGKGEKVERLKGESYNLAGQRVLDSQSYKGIIIESNKKTLRTLKR